MVIFSLQPDYDEIDEETRIKLVSRGKSDKGKNQRKYGELIKSLIKRFA